MNCNICNEVMVLLYTQDGTVVNSSGDILAGKMEIFHCVCCNHVHTVAINDLEYYYDNIYKYAATSDEEDQIYSVEKDQRIYRTQHQINTLLKKLNINACANILDFGCGKGLAMKELRKLRPDINIHLFDISKNYIDFWKKLCTDDYYAIKSIKSSWEKKFDVVTSFFSLEHIEHPISTLESISNLLVEEGYFYCIVPNMYENISDFVVFDHINHFSQESIYYLYKKANFKIIEIDDKTHKGALIIIAKKENNQVDNKMICHYKHSTSLTASDIANYWKEFSLMVKKCEVENSNINNVAIYGAGVYGKYIFTNLKEKSKVKYFIDVNPHFTDKSVDGIPIITPEQLPTDIDLIYVGLNPKISKSVIENIECWKNTSKRYLFLSFRTEEF